jgi:hypothetical protein
MPWDAQSIIAIITALSSLITVAGGTYIAIKQAGIAKKVDDAKSAATDTAAKLTANAETRAAQITDLKETIIAAVKGNGHS